MYSHQNPPLEPQADHSYAQEHLLTREKEAVEYVQHLKGLYMHLIIFAVLLPALGLLNYFISPEVIWVIYVAIPWSLAIMLQALITFSFFKAFGPQWEQRQFRKRMKQSR